MDSSTPPPNGRQPPLRPDAPDPGESRFQAWLTSSGVGAALNSLRTYQSSTPPLPPPGTTVEDALPRLGFYPDIVSGPPLTRVEEVQLKKHLDSALVQVQIAVRALNMEPVQVTDLITSRRTDAAPVYPIPKRRVESGPCYASYWRVDGISGSLKSFMKHNDSHPMAFRSKPVVKPDSDAAKNEEVAKKLVNVIDDFTTSMKDFIATKVATGTMTAEFAEELFLRIDCLNQNVQLTVKSSGHCFSLSGLRDMMKMPDNVTTLFTSVVTCAWLLQKVSTVAECIVDNIGTTPGQYTSIGKEATSILNEDFCLKNLELNCVPFEQRSCAVGAEYCGVTDEQFLMKLRGHNKSLLLFVKSPNSDPNRAVNVAAPSNAVNAAVPNAEADVFSAKLAVDKFYWKNLTCVIECPYPSLHGKIEMKTTNPYWAYACDIGLPSNPKINMSFLLGVKAGGVGALCTYDYKKGEGEYGFGMRIRKSLAAYGVTYKRPGTVKATVCQKILNSTTTVAAVASYSPVAGEERGAKLTLGLKHAVKPSLYIKARAGSSGASIAMKKTIRSEKCTMGVKAACNVDVKDPWRCPKFGLVFSFRA